MLGRSCAAAQLADYREGLSSTKLDNGNITFMKSEAFMVVKIHNLIFWVMTSGSPVDGYHLYKPVIHL
jgi:hypothetical protein